MMNKIREKLYGFIMNNARVREWILRKLSYLMEYGGEYEWLIIRNEYVGDDNIKATYGFFHQKDIDTEEDVSQALDSAMES